MSEPLPPCCCGHVKDGHVVDGYCLACHNCPGYHASPPLPESVVEILKVLHANEKSIDRLGIWSVELDAAVVVWIAAGRPGLEK